MDLVKLYRNRALCIAMYSSLTTWMSGCPVPMMNIDHYIVEQKSKVRAQILDDI